ncbi:MAG: acyl-CoA reductase, partial [Vicinamibacterales bacterium]
MSATAQAAGRRPWHEVEGQVRVLAPDGSGSLAAFMDAAGDRLSEPFAAARIDTVARLSSGILRDPTLRQDPASVAAAYWMRKATVTRLKERYVARCASEPGVVRVPVGRVFHVAPSNVDTLFVYSWVLSFLCGNANLVRVSQQQTPVVTALLRVFGELAQQDAELRETNRFVTYEHDAAVTAALSAWCSHRIIWGGDSTVDALRPLALSPHASERLFGSKFSYAVIGID